MVAILLTTYSIVIIFMLFFSASKERYFIASHMQGSYLSQSMFDILKFQDPENAEIPFEQSIPFNKRGEYAQGFQLLDAAVEKDPLAHLGYRGYMKLRFLRDYEGALQDFNRLDTLTPGVVDTPWGEDIDFLRGEAHIGLKNCDIAAGFFRKSIENQGKEWADLQNFVYLGMCAYSSGDFQKAIEILNESLEISEYTAEVHYWLARTYLETENLDQAQEHLALARQNLKYKRENPYNEYLNEVYLEDLQRLEENMPN